MTLFNPTDYIPCLNNRFTLITPATITYCWYKKLNRTVDKKNPVIMKIFCKNQ